MTKTMKMVSASKLRKAHLAQASAKHYAEKITDLISRVSISVDSTLHPLLDNSRKQVNKILIVLFTSNKGLCGSFNNALNRQVASWMEEHRQQYQQMDLSCCGKRGFMFFRRRCTIKTQYENRITENPDFSDAIKIGDELAKNFVSGQYDEIYLAYNQFFNPISQKANFLKILPIDPTTFIKKEAQTAVDYLFEPPAEILLSFLIPHYLYFRIYFTLLENSAGEHGARMTAMDNASKNTAELIGRYTLLRNRARQAAITTELIEIVSGAEALKN